MLIREETHSAFEDEEGNDQTHQNLIPSLPHSYVYIKFLQE